MDASAFSSASSLFESPSWHAVLAPPAPRAAPGGDARDPRAAPPSRGWAEDAITSASEELRSLRHGLRLLLRSAACLCATQGILWTPRQQQHPVNMPHQEHESESGLQRRMQGLGKGAQLDEAYGELFALMARLLSALTKEQGHSGAGGLSERGGVRYLQLSAVAWLMWQDWVFPLCTGSAPSCASRKSIPQECVSCASACGVVSMVLTLQVGRCRIPEQQPHGECCLGGRLLHRACD